MTSENFQISKETGIHNKLNSLVGEWKGIMKTWFEPGILSDESPCHGTFRSILGGRFIMHEYSGSLEGKPLEGIYIFGYSIGIQKLQCAWVDSFHMGTGILFSEGKRNTEKFSVLGSYGGPGIDVPWGWRTEVEYVNDDRIIITAFNISPDGKEAKATEAVLDRIK